MTHSAHQEKTIADLQAALADSIAYLERLPKVPATTLKIRELKAQLQASREQVVAPLDVHWESTIYTPRGEPLSLALSGGNFVMTSSVPLPTGNVTWKLASKDIKPLVVSLLAQPRSVA